MKGKMQGLKTFLLMLLCLAGSASAEVAVSGRHVYILYPGVDAVWGSYLFLVSNTGTEPQHFNFPVLLPKETVDFQGTENLSQDELKLGPNGGLLIDKVFPPGDTLLNIGFQLPADKGSSPFTVSGNEAIDTLSLFVWQNSMQVEGKQLEIKKGVPFSGRFYDTYTVRNASAGETEVFTLTGVPEGRGRLWKIGWAAFALLCLVGITSAYLTRPKNLKAEEAVL